ncbi:MAG: A/G-specific adenine glycosylase [Verrucomicrobiales bacterium]|jgi:A/G-specific adenine glycosylase
MNESKPAQTRVLPEARRKFQKAIVAWFTEHAEDYPWRRTRDPYAVLVSELMLQQTQIATVLAKRYFERWLEQFPDVHLLAAASEDAILKAWEGLGYYRRARNLQKAAQVIVAEADGKFPESLAAIEALPGVGRYTAGAVMSFAFDRPAPIVDANIARVLARLFDFSGEVDLPVGQKELWSWAEQLLPAEQVRDYNSGLMELGQKICTSKDPQCHLCPVAAFCITRSPEALPVKKPRTKTVFLDEHVLFLIDKNGSVQLQQETGKRRQGLWKLPAADGIPSAKVILKMQYSITHYRMTLIVHPGRAENVLDRGALESFSPEELNQLPMPSPYRKALVALMDNEPFALS